MTWERIPWAPRYEVSDLGEVRGPRGMMKPWINDEGYIKIALVCADGKRRQRFVHKIVAELFLPPPEPGQRYVLHRDNARTNCAASNLRWGTHADNHEDKRANGTAHLGGAKRKLTWNDVRKIRASKVSTPKIAQQLKLSISHVREIRNGRKWRWLDESRQEKLSL